MWRGGKKMSLIRARQQMAPSHLSCRNGKKHNARQIITVERSRGAAKTENKARPPFFFFWASQVYLKNAIVMNCRKLECVPRAPRQNLSESLTFIDPDLPLLSLFFRESLREPLRGRWNTRTAVTSPTMQLCLSRSVCFYSISVLELKIAAKTANRL